MDKETIGNLTTIIKIVIMTIAPTIAVYLGTDDQTVIAFLTACLTFGLAILDAKYPNSIGLFDNQTETGQEEQIIIEDIDPAGDYDERI